jgi:septal ring factor EnvC (AmiA/AmiB activator)
MMIDAHPSEPRKDNVAANRHAHGRLMVGAVAALIIVAGASVWRLASGPPTIASPIIKAAAPAANPVLDQLVEATRALEASQQQAIDQLQELQQLLTAQQAETKKASSEVAALSDKLEALRQSFASATPALSPEQADEPQPGKSKPAVGHARGKTHRVVSARARTVATHH